MFLDILTSEPITMDDQHRYHHEIGEFLSQSAIVGALQEPFDAGKWSKKCAKNVRHEYYGMDPKQIEILWENKNLQSRLYGSDVHNYIENDLSGVPEPEFHSEDMGKVRSTISSYKDLKEKVLSKLDFLHAENIICHPKHGIAGTYDYMGLFQDQLFMLDWKTNEKFNIFGGFPFREPYQFLDNSKWTVYSLQAAIYKYIIEDHYQISLPHQRIVWIKPTITPAEMKKIEPVVTAVGSGWAVIRPRDFEAEFGNKFIPRLIDYGASQAAKAA